jgi:hypothetical protein
MTMNVYRSLSGTMLLGSLLGLTAAARAQEPPPPQPAAPAGQVVVVEPGANGAAPAAERPAVRDGVRLRGGFSVNGGVFFLPTNPVGGAASIAGRLGVQFNHYFSLYYQNTPVIGATVAHDQRSGTVVAADYNSLLVDLTLFHVLDIGAGPSLDYVALAKGSLSNEVLAASPTLSTGTGVAGGGHGRVAFIIGGLSGEGPRRSGFTIGVDAHPMFLSTGRALSLTVGLGAEWY